MKPEDFIGEPCSCERCVRAGVTDKPLRRDPWTGKLLHGVELRRWWHAHDEFFARAKTAVKGMR